MCISIPFIPNWGHSCPRLYLLLHLKPKKTFRVPHAFLVSIWRFCICDRPGNLLTELPYLFSTTDILELQFRHQTSKYREPPQDRWVFDNSCDRPW